MSTDAVMDIRDTDRFTLDQDFLARYVGKQPQWGPLGRVTFIRTYARPLGNGKLEEFWQTCKRVVEGTYTVQRWHCRKNALPWSDSKAQRSAQEMFRLMWDMKFLPPGRGLWMMGTPYVEERGGASLQNCGFVSTENLAESFAGPFAWCMGFSMLGVGVGFDTRGAGKVTIQDPALGVDNHIVADTREGWVDITERVLNAYVGKGSVPATIDYSLVRPAGEPIKGFGGIAAGPGPLQRLVVGIQDILRPLIGKPITSEAIVDLFDMIGVCVVAGNLRRSALLALGDADDEAYLDLKNPEIESSRKAMLTHRWASNNSVFAEAGMDYSKTAPRTAKAGEPGYFWLENARHYARMGRSPDHGDLGVRGGNPCFCITSTVLTPEGIKQLGDISIGDTIWSGQRWTKVTAKWATGIKPVFAFRTRAGTFYGTDNHRIVQHGDKIEVKDAESIDISIGPVASESSLDAQDVMDGLVVGDGSLIKTNNYICLIVGYKDHDWLSSEAGGLFIDRYQTHKARKSDLESEWWTVKTTIKPAEMNYTYLRTIPDRFRYGSPSKVRGFLRGLYSANGSVVGGKRVTLKQSSFAVIEAVQEMLSSLGIRSYYTINKAHDVEFDNGTYTCKQSYDLNIATDKLLFRKLIGFIQSDKQARLNAICEGYEPRKNNGKSSFEISEIEPLGEQEVWDITVEAEEHTLWCGGLLVSNCVEQPLEPYELCTLVETFPARHNSYEEYERTLKFAYLYAKAVTLIRTHDPKTNAVMARNRRIGLSMSGIVQAMAKFGRRAFFQMCDRGYDYVTELDRQYSDWLGVPRSKRRNTVKPSGTVSLLNASTPGIHHDHSAYYYRTIRMAKDSPLVKAHRDAGYRIEDDVYDQSRNTAVIYFPVKAENFQRGKDEVSMFEQLELAAQMQQYWSDNAVSITVTFKPHEAKDIPYALELYETRLKSVSFLPADVPYEQAPYQTITQAEYEAAIANLKPVDFSFASHEETEKFCTNDVCMVKPKVTS